MNPNIKAKKSLGQNFLHDKNIAKKVVDLIDISSEDLIIEIGPGQGILTQFFCHHPVSFVLVEIDSRCVDFLSEKFNRQKNISILNHDILSFDFDSIVSKNKTIKWIGNLPYNITSPVLFRLLDLYPAVEKAVFMVQHEVAKRIVADYGNKNYGILSVLMQTFYEVSIKFSVSNKVFKPQPKVSSAVILLDIKKDVVLNCERLFYRELIKTAFNQRRKQLKNSLERILNKKKLEKIPFDFSRRAEEIPLEEWNELCQLLEKKKNLIQAANG